MTRSRRWWLRFWYHFFSAPKRVNPRYDSILREALRIAESTELTVGQALHIVRMRKKEPNDGK